MRIVLLLVMVLTARTAQAQQLPLINKQSFQNASAKTGGDVYGVIAGKVIRETPHFQIYAEQAYVPVDLNWLAGEVEAIHAYLVERLGVRTTERFALVFRPRDTDSCPKRGLARVDEQVGQAVVFADDRTSRVQISGVLAHEIAHLLHDRALNARMSDENLMEGLASWAAGKYWDAWQGAVADNVRTYRSAGRYIPLEDYYHAIPLGTDSAECLRNRDLRYNSWAAFIDSLITDYGMEKFVQLLGRGREVSSATTPSIVFVTIPLDPASFWRDPATGTLVLAAAVYRPTVFKQVYGLSLSELEMAWLEKLDKEGKTTARAPRRRIAQEH
jgi:hypothetical protein